MTTGNTSAGSANGEGDRVFSLRDLNCAMAGNRKLAEGVADAFLKIRPELQLRLSQALHQFDLPTASQAAHELRGMATMLGATRLASAAAAIQMNASGETSLGAGLHDLLHALTTEWDEVAAALAPPATLRPPGVS